MHKTVNAVWKNGRIVTLEPILPVEESPILVTVLDSQNPPEADWKNLQGKYRGRLSTVDHFIAGKNAEKGWEL